MVLHNLVPTKIYSRTPHELWTGRKPNLQNLKVWGFFSSYINPITFRSQLDSKTIKGTFIAYPENSKGYRFVIHHNGGTISVIESRDARFLEEEIDTRDPNKLVELFEISKEKEVVNNEYVIVPNSENPHDTLSRIQRERNPPTKLKDYFTFISEGDVEDPLTIEEAFSALDSLKWEAIKEELDSIIKNDVWELVELPKNRKAIGSKWILKRKFKCDGSIENYKARLVAK